MKAIHFIILLFLVGCDTQPDRFTELTGSGSEVERVYICSEIAMWDATHLRILRDSVTSVSTKESIIDLISEADDFSGKFIIMLDGYSSDEVKMASRELDKRFTDNELSKLVSEYGKLLKAHCADMLE